MAKSVITAAEVQQAAGSGRLVVPSGAIVTPLAYDVARDLGVQILTGDEPVPVPAPSAPQAAVPSADDDLSARVRTIVSAMLAAGNITAPAAVPKRPVLHASIRDAKLEPFPYPGPPPEMSVSTVDVVTAADDAPMAVGYMTLTKGSFPWTLSYDEAQIVLEGELHLGGDAGGKIGHPGDVLFVPKGSSITFGTPNWAKFVYVTFPANWEDQIK